MVTLGILIILFYLFIIFIGLAIIIAHIIGKWKTLEKTGEAGWPAIVPIYGNYIIAKKSGIKWWFILLIYGGIFIPGVGTLLSLTAMFCVNYNLAKKFGYDPIAYGLGLTLLTPIFFLILGFSKAQYKNVKVSEYGPIPEEKIEGKSNCKNYSSTDDTIFCTHCGKDISNDDKFCKNCGEKIH